MADASSLGITPASGATSTLNLVYNSVFPTQANAAPLGSLAQDSTDISVMSQLDQNVSQDYYQFNFTSGSALKLSFNGTVGPNSDSNGDAPGTQIDGVAANLRYQLYDVTGNLVADSGGTPAQQAAYAALTSSSGLSAANGSYTVKVSAAPGTSITSQTAYNFQLYSGSTYNTSLTYTAQTQPFDPNLFNSATSTVIPASNLAVYDNSAVLSGTQASALNVGTLDANQSELNTSGQANATNQAAYYSFDFNSGTSIKFGLTNTTDPTLAQPLEVQLYDSSGNLVADSTGTQAQQEAYQQFNSGEGLTTANGQYTVKISYAPGSFTSQAQQYNFQLYSGSTYTTQYNTTAVTPSATPSGIIGQNVGVFSDENAQLFATQAFHTIGETTAQSPTIGWIYADQSALNVVSQLTNVDNSEYYNFTLQQGSDLKMTFTNQTNTSNARIQLTDPSGTYIYADNYGTAAQQAAFADLTSSTGLAAKPQNYAVKISYAPGADKTLTQTYDFQLYSGSSYTSLYKTTASAQTYENAVQTGNTHVVGFNPLTTAASYLGSLIADPSNPNSGPNLITDLSLLV